MPNAEQFLPQVCKKRWMCWCLAYRKGEHLYVHLALKMWSGFTLRPQQRSLLQNLAWVLRMLLNNSCHEMVAPFSVQRLLEQHQSVQLHQLLQSITMVVKTKKPLTFKDDPILATITPAQEFISDSIRLVKRCQKPSAKEFKKIAIATGVGFLVMGFVGFFIKLIHIPINNIIIGQ
eukprot:TRINITY_DN3197_c0_g1_i2.p2 TRINITY_DN3197_c0_g1~~TRINITY_DN3197_c0_g1_i2.p2  ORF type:complete len:176 (-),score=34.80 TRINITY_DN3197_c0_g1_i2:45-572(-)